MQYVSTRGDAPNLGFEDVLLTGLARDGGLYVPMDWPHFSAAEWRELRGARYQAVAAAVMAPFVGDAISPPVFAGLVEATYGERFRHPAVVPLKQLGHNDWLLELFHGPTLAFKDIALQFLGRLFDHVLAERGQRLAILGATSGDTGSAAIEAVRDRAAVDIFMLYPHGRVSDVQRRQMTTVDAANVYAIAIEGTFDDAQDIVKQLFGDLEFRDAVGLSAVNSINWARIMAQVVYYATAALDLGAPDRKVDFCVPTGNFGNVFAAYVAKRMGLPIGRLLIGTNRNDILSRFFATGELSTGKVEPSLSPSMDIQVSSNFERLLFELMGRNGHAVAELLGGFRATGHCRPPPETYAQAHAEFSAVGIDDAETLATIRRVFEETGEVLDPHSAVSVAAARQLRQDSEDPIVSLACAHPAKFPDAVAKAIGPEAAARLVRLPPHLDHLMSSEERFTVLPNDAAAVKAFMLKRLGATSS